MSIKVMSRAWEIEAASHVEKLVLLALADNASDQGYCWPCIATIARKSQLSERAVIYRIRALENKKWISVKYRPGHSSMYLLKIPTPAPDAPPPLHGVHHTPACHAPPPLHGVHPEPSFEPSMNRQWGRKAPSVLDLKDRIEAKKRYLEEIRYDEGAKEKRDKLRADIKALNRQIAEIE